MGKGAGNCAFFKCKDKHFLGDVVDTENVVEALAQHYNNIAQLLQVPEAPRIRWGATKEMQGFKGTYDRNANEIKIAEELREFPIEQLYPLIVHEITHHLMYWAGYRSIGHGWQFLAAYSLLLDRLGLGGLADIETCLCQNWPKWPSWPIWYNHLIMAQKVYSKISQQNGFQNFNAIQISDGVLAEGKEMHPFLNPVYHFFMHLSHNVIADTRGHWLACRYMGLACFLGAYGLSLAGFTNGTLLLACLGFLFLFIFGTALGNKTKHA